MLVTELRHPQAVPTSPPSSGRFASRWSISGFLAVVGFILLSSAWKVLHAAQYTHLLATTGIYARLRHPQYVAFIVIMLGFLLQWPTLVTLVMFPVLALLYVRLARREEREALADFGDVYARYAAVTPAFFPRRALRAAPA